jgi:N-acetyl-gamma-glutamyl-phosphate reductase
MTKVAVLGGSGYTAMELMKIALRHPHLEIVAITSRGEAGQSIAKVHPILAQRLEVECENFNAAKLKAKGVMCAFGCLPHGISTEAVAPLIAQGIRVIDLSADYRLKDPQQYNQWYGHPHGDINNLGHAVYGLPELHREQIRTAMLVANPGCYPQTAILGLAPLLKAKIIKPESIIIDSKSGVSGAGRNPKLTTHYPECNENFSAYNVGQHRHTPEIEQELSGVFGMPIQVIFTPHLTPMDRGIFSTIYADLSSDQTDAALFQYVKEFYLQHPFVRVRESLPCTKDTAHTNYLDLCYRVVRNRVVVLACEDNLVRGASGVAVQNFNLMFGYEETLGLR